MTLSSQICYVATLLKDREMAYWKMIEKIIIDPLEKNTLRQSNEASILIGFCKNLFNYSSYHLSFFITIIIFLKTKKLNHNIFKNSVYSY